MTSTGEQPATFITRLVPGMVLKPAMDDAVDRFLGSYAAFAAQHGVAPWLIFMPCKTRALAGRFRWEPPSEETDVGLLPLDLPEIIRLRCERAGVAFYDITPGLTNRAGDALVFNAVVDSHLNAAGAEIVAGLLADQFAGKGIPRQTRSMLPPGGGSAAADAKMDCREEAQNAQGRGDPTSDLPPCPLTAGSRVP